MTQQITASFETLADDGPMIVGDMLQKAIRIIDGEFGPGYARKHPALVGAFITAAGNDFNSALLAQQIRAGLDSIANALDSLTASQN
jgi:hypothetical protein